MGMFMKFKCWGCDDIPCTCTKVERTLENTEIEQETKTTPVLRLYDIAVKDGKDWTVVEIQDGIAIGREVTVNADKEEKKILPPYRILLSLVKTKK